MLLGRAWLTASAFGIGMVSTSCKSCLNGTGARNRGRVRWRRRRGSGAGGNEKRTEQGKPDDVGAHRSEIPWRVPFHMWISAAPSNKRQDQQVRLL